jgi:hypothetical protein
VDILDDNLLDLYMGILKGNIQHEVHLLEPTFLEKAFRVARKVESKNMATRRTTTNTYKEHNVPSPNPTQPTRLTPQQLDESREKGLCFYGGSKYSKGHNCDEWKLLYIECEEEE